MLTCKQHITTRRQYLITAFGIFIEHTFFNMPNLRNFIILNIEKFHNVRGLKKGIVIFLEFLVNLFSVKCFLSIFLRHIF